MNIYRSILLGASLATLPVISHADLGPIVITGTKTAVRQAESAVPVLVITTEQIQNSTATDVAGIIQLYANIDIQRNGPYGKTTSLFVRGTESDHTHILIDGVKINSATTSAGALQNISPDIIEKIEIVKGPRSSLYGSEAIGAVINIITRKDTAGRNLRLTTGLGGNGTEKLGVSASMNKKYLSSGFSIQQFDSDGLPAKTAGLEDHGFDNQTINGFLKLNRGNSDFGINFWSAKGNVEYDSFGSTADQDFRNSAISANWNYKLSETIGSVFRVSTITDDLRQNQVSNNPPDTDFAITDRDEIDFQLNIDTENAIQVSLGLLSAVENVTALGYQTSFVEKTDINSIYALLQKTSESQSYSASVRQTDHDGFRNHSTWNIDYKKWINPSSAFYVGAGTGFRAPSNSDRFGSGGDPDLNPETSETVELGFEYRPAANSATSIAVFNNSIDNLISYVDQGGFIFAAENIAETEISGIELSYEQILNNWQYNVSYLAQNPKNITEGNTLLRRAKDRFNFNFSYSKGLWQMGGSLTAVGARSDFGSVKLDSYGLVNTTLKYQLNGLATITAKIENLFDEDYELASGYNTLGRTAYVELNYSIED